MPIAPRPTAAHRPQRASRRARAAGVLATTAAWASLPASWALGCNALFGVDALSYDPAASAGAPGTAAAAGTGGHAGHGGVGNGGANHGGASSGGATRGGEAGVGGACEGGGCSACHECDFAGQTQCAGSELQSCTTNIVGCRVWDLPEPCPEPGLVCVPGPPASCDLPHPVASFDWANNEAQGWSATSHTSLGRGNPPGGLTVDTYYSGAFRHFPVLPARSYTINFDARGNGEALCGSPRTGARGQLYVTDSANGIHLVWEECMAAGPDDGFVARSVSYTGEIVELMFTGVAEACTAAGDQTTICGEFVTIDNLVIDY